MRSYLIIFFLLNFIIGKDISYKIQTSAIQDHQLISMNGNVNEGENNTSRSMRDDTSTVWLQDFEGDLSDWTSEFGWELTEESSYSPSHSFHMDDDKALLQRMKF